MNSVKGEITGQTIANDVMLQRATHQGSFFLVEGGTDAKLFKRFTDSHKCSIQVCSGWGNLFGAITILSNMGIEDALGFSDRDYFDENGYPEYSGVVIFTDENDLEAQMICSEALNKVIEEYGDAKRVDAEVDAGDMAPSELVLSWSQATGALRFLSSKHKWNLKFDGMKYKFVDRYSPVFCISKTVQHVYGRSDKDGLPSQAQIEDRVRACIDALSYRKIANGHDCVAALARAFHRRFGTKNSFNCSGGRGDLAKILRIAYEYSFFQGTRGYKEIRRWEQATGKSVLKAVPKVVE